MFSGDHNDNRIVFRNTQTTYLMPGSLSWRHFISLGFVFALLVTILLFLLLPMRGWLSIVCILGLHGLFGLYLPLQNSRSLVSLMILPLWRRAGRGEQQA